MNSVYEGHDISASSKAASGRDECEKQCSMEEGCNAVSYSASEGFCWLHKIPEGAEVSRKRRIDAMFICKPAAVPTTPPAAVPEMVPAAAPETVPAYPEGEKHHLSSPAHRIKCCVCPSLADTDLTGTRFVLQICVPRSPAI